MYINLHDSWQLASKLTFKRINNALKVYRSYRLAQQTGIPQVNGLPISLSIEPTTHCNLRCPECPSGLRSFTRPTGKLQSDLYENLLDELSETLIYLILYFQGEPYLHPSFLDLVEKAAAKNIYTATSTNAHYLSDENARDTVISGLNRLIISIDGATQETYESYRVGGQLEKVLTGTEKILKWKKHFKSSTPHVVWQFLVVKPNEHEIPEIKKLARKYGVNQVAFKSAQIYDFENGNNLIPENTKYSRYKETSPGKWSLKHELQNECWKMWHSAVVTWDGQVVPCCFDKDAQHPMGNVSKHPFQEIWQSEKYNQFRKTLFSSRDRIEMCKNCSEGSQVWV